MFERFTTPARRAVFWARYIAGRSGSDWIEPEHLLLGVLAEDQRDWMQAIQAIAGQGRIVLPQDRTPAPPPFFTADCAAKLREILTTPAGAPKPDVVDMPVSKRCQRLLAASARRSERGSITLLDLVCGLMTDASLSGILGSVGITIAPIDEAIRKQPG